jgi:uncharacterized protein YjbJ (UPF0337 family)
MNDTTTSSATPSVLESTAARWKQQLSAAMLAWGQLTEVELMKLEGQGAKLTALIQERYAITKVEAARQVKAFFAKHQSCSCCK